MNWFRSFLGHKTAKDLIAEVASGKRAQVSGEELERALENERRQLPKGLRFPKEGEIYEAVADFKVSYMTAYLAPYTLGGESTLPKGERVRISKGVVRERPIGVYCDPLRYDELHHLIVSESERANPLYDGYYFFILTVDLNNHFRLVEDHSAS